MGEYHDGSWRIDVAWISPSVVTSAPVAQPTVRILITHHCIAQSIDLPADAAEALVKALFPRVLSRRSPPAYSLSSLTASTAFGSYARTSFVTLTGITKTAGLTMLPGKNLVAQLVMLPEGLYPPPRLQFPPLPLPPLTPRYQ